MRKYYADAHCHTNPVKGMGADNVSKLFKKHNGWFIALVSLPPYHYGFTEISVESYRRVFDLMISEKKRIVENGLDTKLLVGFHPAEVDEYFRRGLSPENILDLAEKVLDLIIKYYREGLIDGIGEVGRQHYSTSPSRLVVSELIMLKTLEYARDHDLIIHLHLEQNGLITIKSIDYFISKLNIPRSSVLIHHADYETSYWSEKYKLWYSIPAKEKDLEKNLVENREYILVESDFIDDPRRPGVSSYPWDIVNNIEKLVGKGFVKRDVVDKIMIDNIVRFYRVNPP